MDIKFDCVIPLWPDAAKRVDEDKWKVVCYR
jgi:hypothetical protein